MSKSDSLIGENHFLEDLLNLQKNSKIAGVKAIHLRDFLKKRSSFSLNDVDSVFGSDKSSYLILHLIEHQWIEKCQDHYRITYSEEVSRFLVSKVQKRFSKTEGESLLVDIKKRCLEIENDPNFFYKIESLILFGSMLNPKSPDVGDVDILVGFNRKSQCEKQFSAMVSRDYRDAFRMQENILKFLQSKNRKISIHDMSDAPTVLANGKPYKVIFGEDSVKSSIAAA